MFIDLHMFIGCPLLRFLAITCCCPGPLRTHTQGLSDHIALSVDAMLHGIGTCFEDDPCPLGREKITDSERHGRHRRLFAPKSWLELEKGGSRPMTSVLADNTALRSDSCHGWH